MRMQYDLHPIFIRENVMKFDSWETHERTSGRTYDQFRVFGLSWIFAILYLLSICVSIHSLSKQAKSMLSFACLAFTVSFTMSLLVSS
jgi:hypothetical protein